MLRGAFRNDLLAFLPALVERAFEAKTEEEIEAKMYYGTPSSTSEGVCHA